MSHSSVLLLGKMSEDGHGIKELLAAEKQAAEIVLEAKKSEPRTLLSCQTPRTVHTANPS